MRLIATFNSEERAKKFSRVLLAHEIEAFLEKEEELYLVWAISEDQVKMAQDLLEEFEAGKELKESTPLHFENQSEFEIPAQKVYVAPLTRFFVFLCVVVFIGSYYQSYQLKPNPNAIFPTFTKVTKNFMYDFPIALEYADELSKEYTITKETKSDQLPEGAQALLKKIEENPIWPGIYYVFLNWKDRVTLLKSPLFVKIREGEVWRFFTPILLHAQILHLLFNMLWLWLLGKMIENNMKTFLYILFIGITAFVTNTIQYIFSGPFFMGFSGVVSAMCGYIWVRKKLAPWEIYPVDFATLGFLGVFILGMFLLQVVAFFLQLMHIVLFQFNIANAAHVSGLFLGMILGRIKVFQRKM